jgi:transcriptional regulator with XRE-family HTH domain
MILATGVLAGTGGTITVEMLNLRYRTGAGIILRFPSINRQRLRRDSILFPPEQIVAIRRYLSLSISDLARVLLVERPTIYSWLRSESVPRAGNLDRIRKIYLIAREWRSMSTEPVKGMLNTQYGDNPTLLALLSEEKIDEPAARRVLTTLRDALERVPKRQSVAEIAKEKGIRLPVRELTDSISDEQFNF